MGITIRLLSTVLMIAVTAGCAILKEELGPAYYSGNSQTASGANVSFPVLDSWLSRNMVVVTAGLDGQRDYDRAYAQGAAIVYGEGIPAPTAFDPGIKRQSALRAAEDIAQRNLAEFLAGNPRSTQMQQGASFNQMQAGSAVNRTDVGVKGAVVVAQEYNDQSGRAAVLLKYDMRSAKGVGR